MNMKTLRNSGFTLIELLIVMAVLGVLITVVVVLINPAEQLARGRDASRKTIVAQLGHAIGAYMTSRNGVFLVQNNTWQTTLASAQEIGNVITAPAYTVANRAPCAVNNQNNVCYMLLGAAPNFTGAAVYATLESAGENDKSDGAISPATGSPNNCTGATGGPIGIVVWISNFGRAGLQCIPSNAPIPDIALGLN